MGKYKVEGFEKQLSLSLSLSISLLLILLRISLVTSVSTFQHHFQSTYTLLHLLTSRFHFQGWTINVVFSVAHKYIYPLSVLNV